MEVSPKQLLRRQHSSKGCFEQRTAKKEMVLTPPRGPSTATLSQTAGTDTGSGLSLEQQRAPTRNVYRCWTGPAAQAEHSSVESCPPHAAAAICLPMDESGATPPPQPHPHGNPQGSQEAQAFRRHGQTRHISPGDFYH